MKEELEELRAKVKKQDKRIENLKGKCEELQERIDDEGSAETR